MNNNPLGFTDPSGYLKLFGKKWSWWRDTVVKPVVAIAAAWVIGPVAYNVGFWGAGGAALTAGASPAFASLIGSVAGGALAGAATGAVAGGLYGGWDGALQGAKLGAIGGAVMGPISAMFPEYYNGALKGAERYGWSPTRVLANSLGGGVASELQEDVLRTDLELRLRHLPSHIWPCR